MGNQWSSNQNQIGIQNLLQEMPGVTYEKRFVKINKSRKFSTAENNPMQTPSRY
jgi:hypothetical protein